MLTTKKIKRLSYPEFMGALDLENISLGGSFAVDYWIHSSKIDKKSKVLEIACSVIRSYLSSDEQYGIIDNNPRSQSATQNFFNWLNDKKRKTKKAILNAYDGAAGIDRAEFKRRQHLNSEHVNLFELQRDLLVKACERHNCDGAGANPEVQSQVQQQGQTQIQQQGRQNQQRKPSAQ